MSTETAQRTALVPDGSDGVWVRVTGSAAIVFVVLTVAGLVVAGTDPAPGGPLADVRIHFIQGRVTVIAGAVLQSLGAVAFLVFAAGLAGLTRHRGGDRLGILDRLLLAGGICWATLALVVSMAAGALAHLPAAAGDSAVQAIFFLYMLVPVTSFPLVLFLAAAGAGVIGSRVVPRWLGWTALVLSALLLVGTFGLGELYGPLQLVGYFGGFLPFLLWALLVGIALLVRSAPTRSS